LKKDGLFWRGKTGAMPLPSKDKSHSPQRDSWRAEIDKALMARKYAGFERYARGKQ